MHEELPRKDFKGEREKKIRWEKDGIHVVVEK